MLGRPNRLRAQGAWYHDQPPDRKLATYKNLGLNVRRFIHVDGDTNREPQRIAARRPGHMVHVDIKKVGRIPDSGEWRVHGRDSTQAKAATRAKTAGATCGYVYLHSAIDRYSRLAYTEALPDEKTTTAIGFVQRAGGGSPRMASPGSSAS